MKKLAMVMAAMLISASAFAGNWKLVATDTVWSTFPQMAVYSVNSTEKYSNILVRVTLGTARIQNAFLETKNHGQIPLWPIQGDYRSPRDGAMSFPADQIRNIRMDIMSLEKNTPVQMQIYMR
ncbi:MAG: hypothetical protein ACM3MG_14155 [Bacillota bacterium]